MRDGAPEQLLVKAGVTEKALDRGNGIEANLKKLLAGRVDMVAFNIPAVMYNLARMAEDPRTSPSSTCCASWTCTTLSTRRRTRRS